MQRFCFEKLRGIVMEQISTISVGKKMCLKGEVFNISSRYS
jgi:hypothetical protein